MKNDRRGVKSRQAKNKNKTARRPRAKTKRVFKMSVLVQNLLVRMRLMGFNQKGLAVKAGLNETAVRDILKGRSKDPQYGTLVALANVLECKVEELFREPSPDMVRAAEALPKLPGRGRPAKDAYYTSSGHGGYGLSDRRSPWVAQPAEKDLNVVDPATAVFVEELDLSRARSPRALTDGRTKQVAARWQVPLALVPETDNPSGRDLVIVEVVGDAMAPDFMPGDRVLVNTKDTSPSPAGVFLLWNGEGFILRRCETVPSPGRTSRISLRARNPEYGAYEVKCKDIDIGGRVLWRWHRV